MSFWSRIRSLYRTEKLDAEMAEEMRHHLDAQMRRNLAAGMSLEEAHYAAQRSFGGVEQIKERARDQRGFAAAEEMLQNLRYAFRALRKSPVFTAVAIASLAIGIGANIAIFGLLNDMVLRPLPVRNPGELVLLGWHRTASQGGPKKGDGGDIDGGEMDPASGQPVRRLFSTPAFEALRTAKASLAEMLAMAPLWQPILNIDGQPERVDTGHLVSGNFHAMLGVPAVVGRTLRPDDDQVGAAPVVVISYNYWQRRFARDSAVVGKNILLNRTPVTIVGVTAPGFVGAMLGGGAADITVPFALTAQVYPESSEMPMHDPGFWWLRIMGRMKPGASADQVRASLAGPFRDWVDLGWNAPDALPRLIVSPGGYGRSERARASTVVAQLPLFGMATLLLLVACANLANLLLARGAARRRELAVRLALGAGHKRLVRQLFTESMVVALLGAALGVVLAVWGIEVLGATLPVRAVDREMFGIQVDWRVVGFSAGLALLTAIFSGLVPAWRATRLDLTAEFQGGPRALSGGARSRLSRGLMIAQVALSLVLLVGAGLLARTVRNLLAVDIGFNRDQLLLFSLEAVPAGYAEGPRLEAFYRSAAERIAAIGGVRGVTFSRTPVLSRYGVGEASLLITGDAATTAAPAKVSWNQFEAQFFRVYEMSLRLGRGFTSLDNAAGAGVVVVNQTLAEKFFPHENPIGRHVQFVRGRSQRDAEIVGVVRDFHQVDLRRATPPTIYTPAAQGMMREAHFAVRTLAPPSTLVPAIRKAVAEIDPNVPLANVRTQAEQIEWTVAEDRLVARLATFLGLAALALACVGLYGLMSYGVSRRTGEIGLRMALGAPPRRVLWMVLRESLVLVGIGVAVGLVAASAATRLIASILFGLSPNDPLTYGAAALLLAGVALIACLLPAWRAAKIDPMVALRCE